MNNLDRYYATAAKFGWDYMCPGNPRMAWKNVSFGVTPKTNLEAVAEIGAAIENYKKDTRVCQNSPEFKARIKKWEAALDKALHSDPNAQAENYQFDPARKETFPEKFWAYFNSLK